MIAIRMSMLNSVSSHHTSSALEFDTMLDSILFGIVSPAEKLRVCPHTGGNSKPGEI